MPNQISTRSKKMRYQEPEPKYIQKPETLMHKSIVKRELEAKFDASYPLKPYSQVRNARRGRPDVRCCR